MTGATPTTRWALTLVLVTAGCSGSSFTAAPDADGSTVAEGGDVDADAPTGADSVAPDAHAAPEGSAADAASHDSSSASDTGLDSSAADALEAEAAMAEAATVDAARLDGGADVGDDGSLDEGASDAGPDVRDAGTDVEPEACAPVVYFLDGDGDGYGGTTTTTGCVPPDSGTWVTRGGDCDDSNPTVNPGQGAYFTVGYVPTGKSTVSFDYDCDGQESESGSAPKAYCAVVNLSCGGSGYIEASPARSGAGVDPFCGSAEAVTCALTNLVCQAGSPHAASPIACH